MLKPALLILLTLAACSKKGHDDELPIPADISFNEKALPPMSEDQIAKGKLVAKACADASVAQGQLLIKKDQTGSDQDKRARQFNQLRPEVQGLVQTWRQDCSPNPVKNGNGVNGQPKSGQVYRSLETNELSGPRCPVRASEKIESTITVANYTAQPLAFSMTVLASGFSRGEYLDAAQARVVGANSYGMTFTVAGRYERAGQTQVTYTRMNGQGDINSFDLGKIHVEVTGQNLERSDVNKELSTYRITQGGQVFVFTQYFDSLNKVNSIPRYFLGNRELTREEVMAMGEFPFSLN